MQPSLNVVIFKGLNCEEVWFGKFGIWLHDATYGIWRKFDVKRSNFLVTKTGPSIIAWEQHSIFWIAISVSMYTISSFMI